MMVDDNRCKEPRRNVGFAGVQALVSQTRDIHVTRHNENSVLLAGVGIAVSAMAARYGLQAYRQWQVSVATFSSS